MRGKKLLEVLKLLGRFAGDTADFIDAVITPENTKGNYVGLTGYRPYRGRQTVAFCDPSTPIKKQRQRAYEFLYRLKKDGLAKQEKLGRRLIWEITSKGREKEKFLKKLLSSRELPAGDYKRERSDAIVIVSFDVPEKQRRKRHWLRAVLKRLEFRMLQKSVWIGKVKIPKEFIDDLQKLDLLEFVEIFAVTKAGTIRHVV